jgi:tRNA pseudouridine32 synthase/23S rRNA pseudouridine746 synthase
MKISIIACERDFYIVEKPYNESFHSEQGEGFFVRLSKQLDEKIYPVHRLDKVTSGLMIVARNKTAAANFGELFNDSKRTQLAKYYLAIAHGKPTKKQGCIKGDIVKARRGSYKLAKSLTNPSQTQFISCLIEPGKRLYLLKPITGKTHQLRVVLKSQGVPILGDKRYGGDVSGRVHLHAYAIKFDYLGHNYSYTVNPTTGDFSSEQCQKLIGVWSKPWQIL